MSVSSYLPLTGYSDINISIYQIKLERLQLKWITQYFPRFIE